MIAEESISHLNQLVQQLQDDFLAAGADAVEISCSINKSKSAKYEMGDISVLKQDDNSDIGIKIIKGGALAYIKTNTLDPQQFPTLIQNGLIMARHNTADTCNILTEPHTLSQGKEAFFDAQNFEIDVDQHLSYLQSLINQGESLDKDLKIDSAGIDINQSYHRLSNTHGHFVESLDSEFVPFLMGMLSYAGGKKISGFDYDYQIVNRADQHLAAIDKVSRGLINKLNHYTNPQKTTSFKGTILLSPDAFNSMVVANFNFLLSGKAVNQKTSRFHDQIGKLVTSPVFSLYDNPFHPQLGTRSLFDSEGRATSEQKLIDQGVLNHFMYNNYYGALTGEKPTGNAQGSGSQTSIGIHCPVVKSGSQPYQELAQAIEKGVYVSRFSGDSDPLNGTVSGVAKGATAIKSGKLTENLIETMVSIDFFDMLRQITALSSETHVLANAIVPYAVIEGVDIVGG